MSITTEMASRSLNHVGEILCGDAVQFVHRDDSDILVLADGMGSGVRANMLSTLTSQIFGKMLEEGAALEDCVETVVDTLPADPLTGVSFSTFTVLQIFHDGRGILFEYENPGCIFIRGGELVRIPRNEQLISGKAINTYRFTAKVGDTFLIMTDGTVHAGLGSLMSFGWPWEEIADFALRGHSEGQSPLREAVRICDTCNDLYGGAPGDDTTVACVHVTGQKRLHLMTGPARNRADDERMVRAFMSGDGTVRRIVSGGTSASIVSRVLKRPMTVSMDYGDSDLPPEGHIAGIDLVTEGVLTLARVIQILKEYADPEQVGEAFFRKLDEQNPASRVARMIIEDCTEVRLYVGTAVNAAYQNPDLPLELGLRMNLTKQLSEALEAIGKKVEHEYY
ncbi:MAG: serine/threonine-protein phosphatase [Oscillospiraceae bacterium]|nr:serine/threonine-protein phosphatase [Oscillospiraceae bacterium]